MTVRTLLVPLVAAGVLVAGCSGDGAPATSASIEALGALETGQQLPHAELPLLRSDGTWSPADLEGRPAVINFWATWCAYCVEEMPDLERVHQQLGEEVVFVGVDVEDALDEARTLAEETGVTYTLVVDDDRSYFQAVEGRGMPTTVLVTADGTIAYRHAGPLTAAELRALIDEHLDVSTT